MTHGKAFVIAILVLVAATVSCGGGGISSTPIVSPTPGSNIAISSVTPDSAVVATPVTVQVTGSGFDSSSIIMFDGKPSATTYVSSSLVSTSVPADSATQPADVNVVVSNASTKQESNALRFRWVKSVSVTTTALPNAVQGSSYQVTVAASGGKTPYTWKANSGLPAGLTMSTSGAIAGTPTAAGSYSVSVTVTDSSSPAKTATATLPLAVTPEPLALTSSSSLPNASVGKTYSTILTAKGGVTPYKWSVASGSLPAGLTLTSSTGVISGTPTSSGNSSFTVAVADSSSPIQTQSAPTSVTVSSSASPLAISSSTLVGGTVGKAYSSSASATGGTTPYTWSLASGSLPAGLTLAPSTGVISGTPTTSGTFSFTMAVADASSPQQKQTAATSIAVASGTAALAITSPSFVSGTVGKTYSVTLGAAGGTTPYSWSIASGSLPAGLSLASATGVISGTPTTSGTSSFTVAVTDMSNPQQKQSAAGSITVNSQLSVVAGALPSGTVGTSYSATMQANGGTPAYTWSIASGTLPAGLTLAGTTGEISGNPTTAGTSSFSLKVTDNGSPSQSATVSQTIVIAAATTSTGGTTWYIRPDGGTRYSSNNTSGQCDGKSDVAYPGSGTNQHCAFNDFRYLYSDGTYGNKAWAIAGGDTVIVRGGPWRIGQKGPNSGDYFGNDVGDPYSAYAPVIPAGTATRHTRILGENYASCTKKTQLFGGYAVGTVLNLKGAQYVDVQCMEITDHSQCMRMGVPAYPSSCSSSYPLDDYAMNGIITDNTTHDLVLQDLEIHGFPGRGIIGAVGGNVAATRVRVGYNGSAGWDFDDGTLSTNNATVNASYLTVEWSGCNEEYPITHTNPAVSCYDQNSGGYGDGIGTPDTPLNFTCDHCLFRYNTQDGFDLLHTSGSTISITNSQAYANMGQQWKMGAMSQVLFRNNLTAHDCHRMASAVTGAPTTFNQYLSNYCRAAGEGIRFSTKNGGTYALQGNTYVGYGDTLLAIGCDSAGCSTANVLFQDNIVVGYTSPITGNQANFLYQDNYPIPTVTKDHNIYFNTRKCSTDASGTGERCTDPILVNIPSQSFSESMFDAFDFHMTLSSPGASAGAAASGLTTDFTGKTRPNPPSIGAYER